MLKGVLGASIGALFFCAPAMATPIVSGNYIFAARSICQPNILVTNSVSGDQDVHSVDIFNDQGDNYPGDVHFTGGTAKIDPVAGTAKIKGFQDGGNVLLLQTHGTTEGSSMTDVPISFSAAFSNTDTTITFDGQTFHAFYGTVNKSGIATFLEAFGVGSPASCIQQLEFTRI
jgi:hypothetical protein